MQRFETRFSGKITSINVSGIQRAGCRDGMQQAGMMLREGLQAGSKGLILTGCITGIAFIARWGLQTPWFGFFLSSEQLFRNGSKGQADLWTLCLPDTSVMILHNIPILSKELSHSQWVITASQSCVNTRWQKPMSLQWFLAREKLQMQWITVSLHRHICLQMRTASVNQWLELSVQFPLELSLHSLIYIQKSPWTNSCFWYHYYLIY